jgi:hypothetical protein
MAQPLAAALTVCSGHPGAIAQLGERVVRNDEVGGSIPPGSTTLRPLGYAWRSRAEPEGRSVVPGVAHLGEDGLERNNHFPVNFGGRFSIKLATPSRKSLPRSATAISRLASMVASARVWNGTS